MTALSGAGPPDKNTCDNFIHIFFQNEIRLWISKLSRCISLIEWFNEASSCEGFPTHRSDCNKWSIVYLMQGANLQSYVQAVNLSRGSRGKTACQPAAGALISNLHLKGATRVKDYNALWSSPYYGHIINLPEPLKMGWALNGGMSEERANAQTCFPTCLQDLNLLLQIKIAKLIKYWTCHLLE